MQAMMKDQFANYVVCWKHVTTINVN